MVVFLSYSLPLGIGSYAKFVSIKLGCDTPDSYSGVNIWNLIESKVIMRIMSIFVLIKTIKETNYGKNSIQSCSNGTS